MLTTQTATAPVAAADTTTIGAVPAVSTDLSTPAPAKKWAQVRVMTPAGASTPIVAYPNNPEFGYMRLESKVAGFTAGSWARGAKRSTLIKADIGTLEQILEEEVYEGNKLGGKLIVQEFVLDDAFLNDDDMALYRGMLNGTEDDAIEDRLEGIAKQAGKDGPRLTLVGAPILRFTLYVHTDREDFDEQVDIKVAHDNVAEVTAYQAQVKAAKANLPAGGEN